MYSPHYADLPSEPTIEQLSNHLVLDQLDNPTAWIFVPTRNEERYRGYDATLQNAKSAVIQYKRVRAKATWWLTIGIDGRQHRTLMMNFAPRPTPYAFYAFSLYESYAELNSDFLVGRGALALDKTIFVDAHALPLTTTNLRCGYYRRRPSLVLQARARQQMLKSITEYWSGFDFVYKLKACELGNVGGLESGLTQREIDEREVNVRLNVLRYTI